MKKLYIMLMIISVFFLTSCSCKKTCKHKWSDWYTITQQSCCDDLYNERVCQKCNQIEREMISYAEHDYSNVYFKNETGHYHKCDICGKTSEFHQHRIGNQVSSGRSVCTECGYLIETGDAGIYKNMVYSLGDKYGINIKDFIIETRNSDYEFDIKINDGRAYFNVINDKLLGYIKGEITILTYDLGVTIDTTTIDGEIFIEDDEVYINANAQTPNEIEEYQGGTYYLKSDLNYILNMYTELQPVLIFLKQQNQSNYLLENLSDNIVESVLKKIFTYTKTETGANYKLTLEWIRDFNENLNSKTIKELIEYYYGNGEYEKLLKNVKTILNMRLSTLVTIIEKKFNTDIHKILQELDDIAIMITGNQDETFEKLIGIGFDIEEKLNDKTIRSKSLAELISESMGNSEDEVLEEIHTTLEEIGDIHFYDLMSDMEEEYIKSKFENYLEVMSHISFEFNTDEHGNITDAFIDLELISNKSSKNQTIKSKIFLNKDLLSFDFANDIARNNAFFDSIQYLKMEPTNDNEKIEILQDMNDNVVGAIFYVDNVKTNRYIYSDYTYIYEHYYVDKYICDFSTMTNTSMAYLNCSDWAKVLIMCEVNIESSSYSIEKKYDLNGELIYENTSDITYSSRSTDSCIFDYNTRTYKYIFSNLQDHMHKFELFEVIEPEYGRCKDVITYVYQCNICGEKVKKLEVVGHSLVCDYGSVFDGENDCSKGVTITTYCSKCHEELSKETYTYHYALPVEYVEYQFPNCVYDSKKHGFKYSTCACGEYTNVECIGAYLFDFFVDENNIKYTAYYCSGCDFKIREYTNTILDNEHCCTKKYTTYKVYNGEELLYESEQKEYIQYNHTYQKIGKLKDGAVKCTDGIEVYNLCTNCGYEKYIEDLYTHYTFDTKHSLREYGCGCEDSYYSTSDCICGETKGKVSFVHIDNIKYVGSQYTTETRIYKYRYVCLDCNFHFLFVEDYKNGTSYYIFGCDDDWKNGTKVE